MERRKVTFRLYPNATQAERLTGWIRLHCELYNAALEERIDAWRKTGKSISYYEQQNVLPAIKADRAEFIELGSHALQQTLRRLDLAFQAFFRRVKAGQTPGYPRFKASRRFSGFCYPDPAGWKLMQCGTRGATIRIGSGKDAMSMRARGRHRFGDGAKLNDLTIIRAYRHMPALACAMVTGIAASTSASTPGPRSTTGRRSPIRDSCAMRCPAWRICSDSRRGRRADPSAISGLAGRQVAKLHERIGNLRREFLHQTTSRMVASCAVLATEELRTQNMSRSARGTQDKPGRMVRQKAGLNREILSAGLGMAHNMLAYKAVEAGTRLHVSNTRQLKPSQRCAACWEIVPKTLAQRVHECPHCGHTAPRDQNAASVVLIDAHTPGTGVAARPKPLARQRARSKSVTRETPATASQDP
jgi:putative transposase